MTLDSPSFNNTKPRNLLAHSFICLCLLALTPMASAERYTTFYHTDHLGNVIGTSDDDGVYTPIVGSDYESYGDSAGYSRPAANNPAYTGKKFDRHTGLYYYGGRYYDPQAKRFISPDPMAYIPANPISFNRYAYGNNNPLTHVDPDGNVVVIPIILGVAWLADKGWAAYDGYQDAKAIQSGEQTLGDVVAARALEHAAGITFGAFGRFGVKVSTRVFGAVGGVAKKADGFVDLASPQRRSHILDGDATGGGHRPGTGNPGKSEFSQGWSDDQIMHSISDVATDPNAITRAGRGGRTITEGMRNGIDIRVIQDANGEIVSGFPTNVPRNQ